MSSSLPDGFTVRPVTAADVATVNELVVATDEAVMGWSDSTEADLLDWWRLVDLDRDSWIVEDGSAAAYGVLYAHGETADLDCFVHPARKGLGLGSWLLENAEARAHTRSLPKAHAWALAGDMDAHRLFDVRGYREVRRYYRMLIDFDEPPAGAVWPDGFRVETCAAADTRAFHAAVNDAFAEEWNWVPLPFDEWYERHAGAADFDPALWFIVREGEEIAAVLRGEPDRFGAGWVGAIGVLKPWRKRGIGLALLQHAFAEFHRRGKKQVGLGVDAQNPTGATRLYERAGMHVAYEAIAFQKELA
jgi:GNAT superfamily N-acetyltransferase